MITIDESKCEKDGICIAQCPKQILRFNAITGFPEMKPRNIQDCVVCGHCIAICPKGALHHKKMLFSQCPPIRKELAISADQAVQFLRTRRSARVFRDNIVEPEKIEHLITVARYAPTATNAQLLEWTVLRDRDHICDLVDMTVSWMRGLIRKGPSAVYAPYVIPVVEAWDAGQDRILRNTPALVFAAAPETAFYGMVDVTIALSYLELMAPQLGLSACWAGLLHRAMIQHQPLREFVGLSAAYPHFYPMMLGYPKYRHHRLPARPAPRITWK